MPSVLLFLLQIFQIASFHVTSRCRATNKKLNPHPLSRSSSRSRPASSLSYNNRYFALVLRASTSSTVDDTYNNENYDDKLVSEIPIEKRGIGVGIDLGTTNSAIAILQASKNTTTQQLVGLSYTVSPKILSIPNNGRTMPSIVTILPNNHDNGNKEHPKKIVVGKEAAQLEHEYPESSYRNVKRIIGTGGKKAIQNGVLVPNFYFESGKKIKNGAHEIRNFQVSLPRQLEDAQASPAKLSWSSNTSPSEFVTPEYISSCILQTLFRTAEEATGDKVTRAVIGVPAFFNDAQREATKQACRMAGVNKVRLITEPEAAALAYGLGKDINNNNYNDEGRMAFEDELVLVFDLGGGTFDVSVLAVGGGVMEVVATTGNSMLGGSDFDRKIATWITSEVSKASSDSSKKWLQLESVQSAILRCAEAVRIHLSNSRTVRLALPLTTNGWLSLSKPTDILLTKQDEVVRSSSTHHVITELSRKSMEELCKEEFQSLLPPVREVALLAGLLLPGDAPPSVADAAVQLEKELKEASTAALEFEEFYETAGNSHNDIGIKDQLNEDEDNDNNKIDEDSLLLIRNMDIKAMRAEQRQGRKKSRDLAARERSFRKEKLRAETNAKLTNRNSASVGGAVKVKKSSYGRLASQVVLVGGATRMPGIGRMLTALTGVVPRKTVNPDEAVALGAAIQVGLLDGDENLLGGLKVLNPMQAAVLRALAKKSQLDKIES